MTKITLAASVALAVLAIAGSASAQPMPMAGGWTGLNIGINGGGSFGSSDASESGLPAGNPLSSRNFSLNNDTSGGLGGAQLGYTWQFAPSWAIGIETDIDGGDISGKGQITGAGVAQNNSGGANPGNFVFGQEDIDMLGTVRVRGGFVMDNWFFYGTGGLAYGDVDYKAEFKYVTVSNYPTSGSALQLGWAAGAGVEYRLAGMGIGGGMLGSGVWSVKAEYLYYDLGSHNLASPFSGGPPPIFQSTYHFDPHGSIIRVGLNYNFNLF
jgi:outer membrane immunogenic protein